MLNPPHAFVHPPRPPRAAGPDQCSFLGRRIAKVWSYIFFLDGTSTLGLCTAIDARGDKAEAIIDAEKGS